MSKNLHIAFYDWFVRLYNESLYCISTVEWKDQLGIDRIANESHGIAQNHYSFLLKGFICVFKFDT